jgi:nucleoside-diphosphate-sugar epimerase
MAQTVLCKPNRRILVTGATGFIGAHLVFSLLKQGYTIGIIARASSNLQKFKSIKNKITVLWSDTYSDIYNGIRNFTPDVVIHAAAMVNQQKPGQIADLINANITFGTHILEAMKENNIVKFLNIGTRWQHLNSKRYNPVNLYSATKEAFKDILIYYETKGIKHKTLELGDTYGIGDTRRKIMELLITACQKREKLDLTPGEQVLDLVFVDDICQFILSKITSVAFFDNKSASLSGTVIRLHDLGEMIEKEFKTKGLFNWGGKSYRENETMTPPFYYKKIQLNPNSLETYIKGIAGGVA